VKGDNKQITRNKGHIITQIQDTRNQTKSNYQIPNFRAAILLSIMRHPHPRVRHGAGFRTDPGTTINRADRLHPHPHSRLKCGTGFLPSREKGRGTR
jgi:hypothetical protein